MIYVDVVFTEARIDEIDNVVEVFVAEDRGGAKDNKVIVERGDGIVEIGFGEDQIHDPLTFSKPKTRRRGFGGVDVADP